MATGHFLCISPKIANQNIKQDTLKYANGQSNSYKHDKMADTLFRTLFVRTYMFIHVFARVQDLQAAMRKWST